MREVTAYDKFTDELVVDLPAPGVTEALVREVFAVPAEVVIAQLPVGAEHVDRLQAYVEGTIDLDAYDWFLASYED